MKKPTAEPYASPLVLIGATTSLSQVHYLVNDPQPLFYCPSMPDRFSLDKFEYFAPYLQRGSVNCYFKIVKAEQKQRRDIFPVGHPQYRDTPVTYIVLTLEDCTKLAEPLRVTKRINSWLYTDLDKLQNADRVLLLL
jgi:hypothetical protein